MSDDLIVSVKVQPDEASARATVKRLEDILGKVGESAGSKSGGGGFYQRQVSEARKAVEQINGIEMLRFKFVDQNHAEGLRLDKSFNDSKVAQAKAAYNQQVAYGNQWVKEHNAMFAEAKSMDKSFNDSKVAQAKAAYNQQVAYGTWRVQEMVKAESEAKTKQQIIEKRDMAMQEQRWAAEKTVLASRTTFLGDIHNRLGKVALVTTEVTRAFFGLSLAIGAVGAPAIFGVKYLKDIEDAKMGIAGTVLSMMMLNGVSSNSKQALGIATGVISDLAKQAVVYNVSLQDVATTYKAIVGPGLAAKMTMDQIGKIAVIGTAAVKSMGLDSRQVVQEIRDLVQGGIQAASSTLATALGIKDSDIKAAKNSTEGLFVFLEKRMQGFAIMSAERTNTLSGAWDSLIMKAQMLFSSEEGFAAIKTFVLDISNAIGTIDNGKLKLNPDLVASAKEYWKVIQDLITEFGLFAKVIFKVAEAAGHMARALEFILLGSLAAQLYGAYAALVTMERGVVSLSATMAAASARWASLGLAARGGIIGLAIWGTYTLADMLGIVDKVFGSVDDRIRKMRQTFNRQSSASIKERIEDLGAEASAIREVRDASGKLVGVKRESDLGFVDSNRLRQIKEERVAAARELEVVATREIKNEKALRDLSVKSQGVVARKEAEQYIGQHDPKTKLRLEMDALNEKRKASTEAFNVQREELQKLDAAERLSANAKIKIEEDKANKTFDIMEKVLNKPLTDKAQKSALKEESWQSKLLSDIGQQAVNAQLEIDKLNDKLGSEPVNILLSTQEKVRAQELTSGKKLPFTEKASIAFAATRAQDLENASKSLTVYKDIQNSLNQSTRDYTESLAAANAQDMARLSFNTPDQIAILTVRIEAQKKINDLTDTYTNKLKSGKLTAEDKAAADWDLASALYEVERATSGRVATIEDVSAKEKTLGQAANSAFDDYSKAAMDTAAMTKKAFSDMFKSMEDGLVEFVKTGKFSFGSFVQTVIDGLIRMAAKAAVSNIGSLMGFEGKSAGPDISGLMGSVMGWGKSLFGFAKGAAFGTVMATAPMAFANGGTFSNSILNQPTPFMFASGGTFRQGIAGEAGPEAVMPLKRGANGSLGIGVYGGSQGQATPIQVNVVVNVDSNDQGNTSVTGPGIGQGLGDVIGDKVRQVIIEESRPNGLLNKGR